MGGGFGGIGLVVVVGVWVVDLVEMGFRGGHGGEEDVEAELVRW